MENNLYHYKAIVKRVIDADTIVIDLDCGFSIWMREVYVRLLRIDAYEIRLSSTTTAEMKEKGLEAKDYVSQLIEGKEIIIKSAINVKEKYGRILGEIFYKVDESWINLNDELVQKGYAVLN